MAAKSDNPHRNIISVRFTDEELEKFDRARGPVPSGTFVREVVLKYLGDQGYVPRKARKR